jgi:hypothetical protein
VVKDSSKVFRNYIMQYDTLQVSEGVPDGQFSLQICSVSFHPFFDTPVHMT